MACFKVRAYCRGLGLWVLRGLVVLRFMCLPDLAALASDTQKGAKKVALDRRKRDLAHCNETNLPIPTALREFVV